jgi:hypothetical protein
MLRLRASFAPAQGRNGESTAQSVSPPAAATRSCPQEATPWFRTQSNTATAASAIHWRLPPAERASPVRTCDPTAAAKPRQIIGARAADPSHASRRRDDIAAAASLGARAPDATRFAVHRRGSSETAQWLSAAPGSRRLFTRAAKGCAAGRAGLKQWLSTSTDQRGLPPGPARRRLSASATEGGVPARPAWRRC